MTPAESLVVVQRRFLDLMHERDAALALLRDMRRPLEHQRGVLSAMSPLRIEIEALLARLDALPAKDGAL